jgi:rhamnulokinase
VAVAGHDTLSAAAAAPYADAETVFLSSGTWSVIGVLLPHPMTTTEAFRRGFMNELAVEGILLAKNLIGTYLFENLKRALARQGENLSYAEMVRAAAAARSFACRLDVGAPEFFVTEDPFASVQAYLKRTRQKPLKTWHEAARAILEALAWSFRDTIRDLSALTGRKFRRIGMVGGGTRNRLLCQMVADATGLEVLAGPAEATAAGNVALQAMATGVVCGTAEVRELVRASFPVRHYRPRFAESWNEFEQNVRNP